MKSVEIELKIQELAERLEGLKPEEKRIKKRILQNLGKLKKQLLTCKEEENEKERNEEERKRLKRLKREEQGDNNEYNNENESDEEENNNDTTTTSSSSSLNNWTNKQCKLKLKIANSDIAELAQKKQLKAAQKKFQWLFKKGLTPDVHSYTNLLNAYVRCKDINGAEKLWKQMINVSILPNVVTCTTLIKGYCESGQILLAQSLLLDMISQKRLENTSHSMPSPNCRTLNTYWRGCLRWGFLSPALEILHLIINPNNDNNNNNDNNSNNNNSNNNQKKKKKSNNNLNINLENQIVLDDTSYEYLITLHCQSLDINVAVNYTIKYLESYSTIKQTTLNIKWIEENPEPEVNIQDLPHDTPENIKLLLDLSINRTMNIDTILSTASIYLNLSRAFILLQQFDIGEKFLQITEKFISQTKSSALRFAMENRRKTEPSDTINEISNNNNNNNSSNRDNSNSIMLFIQHRSTEMSREITLLKNYLISSSSLITHEGGINFLIENIVKGYSKTILLYNIVNILSSSESKEHGKELILTQMLTQITQSFGLKNIFNNQLNKKKLMDRVMKVLINSLQIENLLNENQTSRGYYLNFDEIYRQCFCNNNNNKIRNNVEGSQLIKKRKRNQDKNSNDDNNLNLNDNNNDNNINHNLIEEYDVKMEICSGSGEWIIEQALETQRLYDSNRNNNNNNSNSNKQSKMKPILWLSLEIRADRVYQTLYHSIFRKATNNITILGGDANEILNNFIPDNSLTTIFINHPEPPERTSGGEDRSQGVHLLTEQFFYELYRILKLNGKITIVSDNRLYVHALVETVNKINNKSNKVYFNDGNLDDFNNVESFNQNKSQQGNKKNILSHDNNFNSDNDFSTDSDEDDNNNDNIKMNSNNNNSNSIKKNSVMNSIRVCSGQPGEKGDHYEINENSSYFSRMWKNGRQGRVWNIILIKS